MQKFILNFLMVAMLGLLLPACSKKNSTTEQANTTTQSRQQRRGQPRGERPQFSDMLAKMDANKDGKLAQTEVDGRLKDGFAEIDADGDGFITKAEFENAPKPPRRGRN